MNRTSVLTMLAAAATTIALAGCSNSEAPSTSTTTAAPTTAAAPSAPGSTSASSAHNDADITFVQSMIPHHTQAVDMATMAADRAGNDQVRQLASNIEKAQAPEIKQMQSFLAAWGQTQAPSGSMGGMNHSGMSGMGGMMTDAQMQQLQQATGPDFDRMFLQMMTEHHKGAIEMARTELADGQNPEAKVLAQKIINDQQAEINTMQNLLSNV